MSSAPFDWDKYNTEREAETSEEKEALISLGLDGNVMKRIAVAKTESE